MLAKLWDLAYRLGPWPILSQFQNNGNTDIINELVDPRVDVVIKALTASLHEPKLWPSLAQTCRLGPGQKAQA